MKPQAKMILVNQHLQYQQISSLNITTGLLHSKSFCICLQWLSHCKTHNKKFQSKVSSKNGRITLVQNKYPITINK